MTKPGPATYQYPIIEKMLINGGWRIVASGEVGFFGVEQWENHFGKWVLVIRSGTSARVAIPAAEKRVNATVLG